MATSVVILGEKFIKKLQELKPGGYFLLEFANKRNLKNILKFMFGKLSQSPFDSQPLQIGETILNYHPKFIKSLLKQTGFKILKQISASNYRLGFLKRHINLKVLLLFENIYQDIFSFFDTGPSIFLKTVKAGSEETYRVKTGLLQAGTVIADSIQTIKDFEDFKTILCCPACRERNLQIDSVGKVFCNSCKREFYTDEGIYVFK